MTEIIEPSRRSISLPFFDMMSGLGTCLLTLVAFLSNLWFDYILSLMVLSIISAASILYMPASVVKSSLKTYDKHKLTTPMIESSLWLESQAIQNQSSNKTSTLMAFVRSKKLLKSSFMISILFSGSMLFFYGLSLSVGSVSGNIYLNFAILGMADSLSSLALLVKA